MKLQVVLAACLLFLCFQWHVLHRQVVEMRSAYQQCQEIADHEYRMLPKRAQWRIIGQQKRKERYFDEAR